MTGKEVNWSLIAGDGKGKGKDERDRETRQTERKKTYTSAFLIRKVGVVTEV